MDFEYVDVGTHMRPRMKPYMIQPFLEVYQRTKEWDAHDQLRGDMAVH